MSGPRQYARAVLACAVAAAGVSCSPGATTAQNLRPVLREDAEPLPRLMPLRAEPPRQTSPPIEAEQPAPAPRFRRLSEPASGVDSAPGGAAGTSPAASLAVQPTVTPEAEETDGPPTGLRPAQLDGQSDGAIEPEPVPDGVPADPDVYVNPDGADPVQWDARPAEDLAAFERPPAGYDPAAFGVELEALADRRTIALYRFEPWQPRGIRLGTFTVFPTVDLGAAWVSNVFRTRAARADAALEMRPTIRAVSAWRVHALELRAAGVTSFYDTYPDEGDRAYSLEARGRLDVTRRTSIAAGVLRDVSQEARGTLENRLRGGERPSVTSDELRLQGDHRFNRVAVQIRGSMQQRTYDVVKSADGTTISNRDRNRTATEEALRLSYTFNPHLSMFGETAINQRRFEAAPADGIRRDSDGERYRLGVGLGNRGQVLRGEASIGWGRQSPREGRLQAVDGVIVDAAVTWRVNALTAMLLRASSDVVETSTAGSGGGLSRRVDLEMRHAFTRPLIGVASLGYGETRYQGVPITERVTEAALGVEYYLGPNAVLFGRYLHTALRTTAATGGYDADEVRLGLRLRR